MQTVADLINQVRLVLCCRHHQYARLAVTARRLPAIPSHTNSVLQIRSGFSLLSGDLPSLLLQLDGYTILEGSSLDLFRDGDLVTVKVSKAALPLGWPESSKKRRNCDTLSTLGKWSLVLALNPQWHATPLSVCISLL